MSIVVGLTGPSGSGKSSACEYAKELGIKVIDCDKLARVAVMKGTDGLNELVKVFGNQILNIDGSLNRKELAYVAFKTKQNTELLNKTILPFIYKLVLKQTDNNNIILDAPTLFESGIDSICDKTITVLADKQIRIKRIISRDNLTIKEAELRINAGKTDEYYKEKSNFILYNNGKSEIFVNDFIKVINNIFGGNLND